MSSDRDWLGTWLDELTCNGGVYASECGRPPDCSSCETCADHCHCGRDGSEGLEPFDARTLRPVIERVATILGDSRPITRYYGDGSYDCPYCHNAIVAGSLEHTVGRCSNPCCDANPAWEADRLQAHRNAQAKKDAEAKADADLRRSVAAAAALRYAEHEAWKADTIAYAKAEGYCLNCLFAPGWERTKFIRHRNGCPKRR